MKFLPFFFIWLVKSASGHDKLKSCRKNASGNKGICLSEELCLGMGGLNIGMCSSSPPKTICCKTSFVINNEVKNASAVTSQNIFSVHKENKTNCTLSMKKSVPPDLFHNPHYIKDIDSVRNQLNVFKRNYFSEHNLEFSTNKDPLYDDRNDSYEKIFLSDKLYPNLNLKNHASLPSNLNLLMSIKNDPPQISSTEYLPRNQKLHERNPEHSLQKIVNGKGLYVNKSFLIQEYHNLRNYAQAHVTNYHRKPVQTDPIFYIQKPVEINSSRNLQKQTLVDPKSYHRKIVQETTKRNTEGPIPLTVGQGLQNPIQPTNDLHEPLQTAKTFNPQRPMPIGPSQDLHQVVKVLDSHNHQLPITRKTNKFRNPFLMRTTNYLRKPVQIDSTFYLQKPVQVHSSHNLREVVKVSESHDLRLPLVQELDHNLRNPVQVHATNNLRKPVQLDSTFYLQKPVQVHSSHDLRKAVKVADSHDLRWPVVQEPDHDLRNPVTDIDLFRSENEETKLKKIIQNYAEKTHKDGNKEGSNDPIYELLHEDSLIKLKCVQDISSWNNSTSVNRTRMEIREKAFQQKVSFRNSTRACGVPYKESTENFDFHERKLNMGPWMVSVQEYFFGKFRHKCGGSLLNNLWVVTAAHCVDLRPKWDFLLKFRTENNGESQHYVERLVNKISIHPKYNNMNFDNDIALLRMEIPVTFHSNIVPICLPEIQQSMENRKAVIFGWKVATRRDESSGEAQSETVPVLTNQECEVMFSETGVNESIEKNFVCAGARSVKESCTGDSGGPMAILDTRGRWSLAGLYSWGKTCKIPNQPEVYINVKSYVNWIEDTIACFEHYMNSG